MITKATIETALMSWLTTATALEVIRANQAGPRPSTPYVTLLLTGILAEGFDSLSDIETIGDYVDTGSESLTFADANPDTITRSAGSWITDGFRVGSQILVGGTINNNGIVGTIAQLSTAAITLATGDTLTAEVIAGAGVSIGETTAQQDAVGDRVVTASVNVLGAGAWDKARAAMNALTLETVRDVLRTAGLFPRRTVGLDDLTGLQDTTWEPRAHFDQEFGLVDEYSDSVPIIEHAEVTETYTTQGGTTIGPNSYTINP